MKCSLETCIERDVKGLYKKALSGEIKNYTGVSDPYEEPLNPEILIDTDKVTEEEGVAKILKTLQELGYLEALAHDEVEVQQAEEEVYTKEEEEKIKQKLRDLGYL